METEQDLERNSGAVPGGEERNSLVFPTQVNPNPGGKGFPELFHLMRFWGPRFCFVISERLLLISELGSAAQTLFNQL